MKAIKVIKEIEAVRKLTHIPAGVYTGIDGEKYEVEYRYPNEFAVEMLVDGKPVVKVYVQYEGEWRVEDYANGTISTYPSAEHAAFVAFGIKKDWGFN